MNDKIEDIKAIQSKMNEIKRASGSAIVTNYFRQELRSESFPTFCSQNSVVFLDKDLDFHRLYFYSSDLRELGDNIKAMEVRPATIDYVTKVFHGELHDLLLDCGFENIAVYKRFVSNDLPVYETNQNLSFAINEEVEFLHNRLFSDFDKYLDHLPTIEILQEFVENQQVIVAREGGKISGYVIYRIQGKTVNLNYWFNEGNPLNSLQLLTNFYGVMNEKGIRAGFGWARKLSVIKTHEKFGFKCDGLEDYIYLR